MIVLQIIGAILFILIFGFLALCAYASILRKDLE